MSKVFPDFNPDTHTVTVEHVPEWVVPEVVVCYNPKHNTVVFRSLTETEPRWQQWLRRLKGAITRWIDTH